MITNLENSVNTIGQCSMDMDTLLKNVFYWSPQGKWGEGRYIFNTLGKKITVEMHEGKS